MAGFGKFGRLHQAVSGMKSRCATDSVAYFFSVFCAGFRRCMDDACCCLMSGICCMRILRKPARFYFRSRSRAVAGPVSASLRTESRRLLRGFFILRPDRVGSPPRRRRGGRSPHLRAPRPESGRRAGFPSPTAPRRSDFRRARRLRIRCSPWR